MKGKDKEIFSYQLIIQLELQKIKNADILRLMLEELKLPIEQLKEEIMNVWGRL